MSLTPMNGELVCLRKKNLCEVKNLSMVHTGVMIIIMNFVKCKCFVGEENYFVENKSYDCLNLIVKKRYKV